MEPATVSDRVLGNPRVLLLEPAGNLWGSELAMLDFLAEVPGSPWRVAVCCPPDGALRERLSRMPIEVFPWFVAETHRKGRGAYLRALLGLLAAALRFRPALIHVNQGGATRIALIVGRLLRIPVVAHIRLVEDVDYVAGLNASPTALPALILESEYIRREFDRVHFEAPQRLRTIYHPYDIDARAITPSIGSRSPSGEIVVACVARLARIKGQDLLLDALAVLKHQGLRVRGVFVGRAGPGDTFGEELLAQASRLGIDDQVTWTGALPEVIPTIAESAALVFPSHAEPLGRVMYEAWAAGRIPIAWAGAGGPAEVIGSSRGGLLYDAQTGESIARSLRELLDLPEERKAEMVTRGREWVRAHCDPAVHAAEVFRVWAAAAGRHPQRSR